MAIVRAGLPVSELTDDITPLANIFTIAHLPMPNHPTTALTIDGLVSQSKFFTLDELLRMPTRTITAVHECAGNPLALEKPVRRVANVRWSGVSLSYLLDRCGVSSSARYIVAEGIDHGVYPPTGVEVSAYRKNIPLDLSVQHDALIATHINDIPLPLEHGASMRLVIPGFYGTNSVKWLARLTLSANLVEGHFASDLYTTRDSKGLRSPITRLKPHSLLVDVPSSIQQGIRCVVWGWAWSVVPIVAVEIRVDKESEWRSATLRPRKEWEWQRFECEYIFTTTGRHVIAARAVDANQDAQPAGDGSNKWHRVKFEVY